MYQTETLKIAGENFEFKLLNQIIGTKKIIKSGGNKLENRDCIFGLKVIEKITPKYFSDINVRKICALMLEYYNKYRNVPYYDTFKAIIRKDQLNKEKQEILLEFLKEIQDTHVPDYQWVQEYSIEFFDRQNAIILANSLSKELKKEKFSKESVDKNIKEYGKKINKETEAYEVSEGNHDALKVSRQPIPIGLGEDFDTVFNGGVARGELVLFIAGTGVGKAQPNNSKVYTPDGYKLLGDLVIGDEILGSDGLKQEVIGVYPQGKKEVFRIEFDNGAKTMCCKEHLWSYYESNGTMSTDSLENILNNFNTGKTYKFPNYTYGLTAGYFDNIYKTVIDAINGKPEIITAQIFKTKEEYYYHLEYFYAIGYPIYNINESHLSIAFYQGFKNIKSWIEIVNITKIIEPQDCTCIGVSNKDQLYITDDFIVTHNTTSATVMANSAFQLGYNVLQIIFEDTEAQIRLKQYATWTGLPINDVSKSRNFRSVARESDKIMRNAKKKGGRWKVKRFKSGTVSSEDIGDYIESLKIEGFTPDMVLVDYLKCLSGLKGVFYKNKWEKEPDNMRNFEVMCSKQGLNFACYVFKQGSRNTGNTTFVDMSDSSGDFEVVQIAHAVITASKTYKQRRENTANIAILKNRMGGAGEMFQNIYFDNARVAIKITSEDVVPIEEIIDKQARKK